MAAFCLPMPDQWKASDLDFVTRELIAENPEIDAALVRIAVDTAMPFVAFSAGRITLFERARKTLRQGGSAR